MGNKDIIVELKKDVDGLRRTLYPITHSDNVLIGDPSKKKTLTETLQDIQNNAGGTIDISEIKEKLNTIEPGAEQNQNSITNIIVNSAIISATTKTDSIRLIGSNVTLTSDESLKSIKIGITKSNVIDALGFTPYTQTEIKNLLSSIETNIDWKESVETFADIATTYPEPEDGWTVNVKDTDYTYRYNGSMWVTISANAIPKATNVNDGLLTKEDHVNYDDANTKKHEHSNKEILDATTAIFTIDDKNKLDNMDDIQIPIDDELNDDSTNPVQNKIIKAALDKKVSDEQLSDYAKIQLNYEINETTNGNKKTFKTGWIGKLIESAISNAFAISHVESVYYNYSEKKTLADKLNSIDTFIEDMDSIKHEHSNKIILDNTTASYTLDDSNKVNDIYSITDYYNNSELIDNAYLWNSTIITATTAAADWAITNYISCEYGDKICGACNNSKGMLPVIALYDKDYNHLKDVSYSGVNHFGWNVIVDDPNAKYFRANIAKTIMGLSSKRQFLIVEHGTRFGTIDVLVNPSEEEKALTTSYFTKGLSIAYNLGNCRLLVAGGTYDVISELEDIFKYYEQGLGGSNNWGPLIGNNIKVVGDGNVNLIANYTGSAIYCTDYFSILNSTGSFELNGINLQCKNIRYCVHEDIPSITTEPQTTSAKIINCNMVHGGTSSKTYQASCCVGGGTSLNELVVIEGGMYESPSTYPYPISYHNNSHASNTATIIISNVQFAKNNRFQLYGFVEKGSLVDVYVNYQLSSSINVVGSTDRFTIHQPASTSSSDSGTWQLIHQGLTTATVTLDVSSYKEFMLVLTNNTGSMVLDTKQIFIASLMYATGNLAVTSYSVDTAAYTAVLTYKGGNTWYVDLQGIGNPRLYIYAK